MNGPKYIWLQIVDEDGEPIPPDQWDLEATWAQSNITGYDPKYIRADIHEAELSRLREALDGALRSFKLTQNPNDYASTHWSRRAQAALQEEA